MPTVQSKLNKKGKVKCPCFTIGTLTKAIHSVGPDAIIRGDFYSGPWAGSQTFNTGELSVSVQDDDYCEDHFCERELYWFSTLALDVDEFAYCISPIKVRGVYTPYESISKDEFAACIDALAVMMDKYDVTLPVIPGPHI